MKKRYLAIATLIGLSTALVAVAQQPGPHGPAGARGFMLLQSDANQDGRLTRAEFDASQKNRFAELDTNKNGQVTPEEMQAFAAKRREEAGAARFASMDANGDGQLSEAEFDAARPERAGPGQSAENQSRRDRLGMKQSGKRGSMRSPGPRLQDANADGSMSLEEFSARGVKMFERADANSDGTVTIAELQENDRPR